jgi:hypothetical protein
MPHVMTEDETLNACRTQSIARFGDGELRLAIGGSCSSQKAHPKLARELVEILGANSGMLVGIPNFKKTSRRDVWSKYESPQFRNLYTQASYASAFITRPDSAPWIDRPDYWQKVRELWANRDVVLVTGDAKSLTPETLKNEGTNVPSAASVYPIDGPRQHAYAVVDQLQAEIVARALGGRLVVMALGATATVLAARLHARGIHALDLGHIGMFMRHAGAYRFARDDLHSEAYRQQLQQKHATMKWGKSGNSHAPEVTALARELGARSVLDYGCGRGTLKPALPDLKVFEYDPGIPGKDHLPKPADLVVCTDVLEHIEPELLDGVLRHLYLLAGRGAYLVIATRLARELLPDGRNAHLIVQEPPWWLAKLKAQGWRKLRHEQRKGLCVWLEK